MYNNITNKSLNLLNCQSVQCIVSVAHFKLKTFLELVKYLPQLVSVFCIRVQEMHDSVQIILLIYLFIIYLVINTIFYQLITQVSLTVLFKGRNNVLRYEFPESNK